MKHLALALIVLGTVGCVLTLLSTASSLNIDVFGQASTITVTVGATVPVASGLLLLSGIGLWFLAMRRKKSPPTSSP